MAEIDWNLIKEEYIKGNGAVLLKDLATKYGVKDSTVRSRKNREKWDDELNGVATQQCNVAKETRRKKAEIKTQEVEEIMNSELTDKQRLFCIYYTKNFNATQAYLKAYQCSYNVANVEGYKNLVKPSIRTEINRLKEIKKQSIMLTEDDIVERYMRIAFADMTDFVTFGLEEVPVMTMYGPLEDEDGEPVTKKINTVRFKESYEVDGGLICEIGQGKDGAKLKLEDRQKALAWLSDFFEMNVMNKHKKNFDNAKLELEKQKFEFEKLKAAKLDDDIIYVDVDEENEEN